MPTTLTLKNIPDTVYDRLKAAAGQNRRSLNGEAIVRLESSLASPALSVDLKLARIRALRESLAPNMFLASDIDAFKREGRP